VKYDSKHQVSKKRLFEYLAKLGITVTRRGGSINKIWILSNGDTFRSLGEIAAKYYIK
jgi:hypothetical protein